MCKHHVIPHRVCRLGTRAMAAMVTATKPAPRMLCAALGAVACMFLIERGATPVMAQIEFQDFCDVSSLTLNGSAGSLTPNAQCVLRLASSAGPESGTAFTTQPFSLASDGSFSTKFCFRIYNSGGAGDGDGSGADGVTFILQAQSNSEVGSDGGGMGYAGITPSLAVEFDTYFNPEQNDYDGNHVGIDLNGSVQSVQSVDIPPDPRFNDGDTFCAWVDYSGDSNSLEVRLSTSMSRPATPVLIHSVDLPLVLGTTDAFVGFGAGTGLGVGTHEILSWELVGRQEPIGICDVPAEDCKVAGKAKLLIKNSADDSKDKLTFKWLKGSATTLGDLGDPQATTSYRLCLYAGTVSAASVVLSAGLKWEPAGSQGFKFQDGGGTPDGARKALLKGGAAGKAKALVKGKGPNLPDILIPEGLDLPVTVQLITEDKSTCFKAVYDSPTKNDASLFKAKRNASDPGCGNNVTDLVDECDGTDDVLCPGRCQFDCTCAPLPPCEATTGGFCWFLADPLVDCDAMCDAVFRVYDPATATFAGSGGTNANCGAVLLDLGFGTGSATDISCTEGLGCSLVLGIAPTRCTTPTTSSDSDALFRRACACQ